MYLFPLNSIMAQWITDDIWYKFRLYPGLTLDTFYQGTTRAELRAEASNQKRQDKTPPPGYEPAFL